MLYTIKQFIKSGVHLGHYKWECDYRLSYFLLGIRNSIHIINLYYTLFILKQALYIAYNICLLNQKILIANNVGYKLETNFLKFDQKQLWYINNKWIGGLLSNQRDIFVNNEKLFLEFYGLGYSSLLPSYVFASNVQQTSSCIFEAIILNIPCSALLDSNMGFYGIFYGIPSNDDNFVGVYLFTKLFIKMYLKSVYDNINSLKIEEGFETIQKYDDAQRIKLNFIYKKLSYLKYKNKKKYKNKFDKQRRFKNYAWNEEWIKKKAFEDNLITEWKIRKVKKKKFKLKKKKKKILFDLMIIFDQKNKNIIIKSRVV